MKFSWCAKRRNQVQKLKRLARFVADDISRQLKNSWTRNGTNSSRSYLDVPATEEGNG